MESSLVSAVQQLTGNFFALLPGHLGSDTGSSADRLPSNAITLILRADNGNANRVVNVFDTKGNKVYTIERQTGFDKHWHIFAQPEQRQVAAVTIGLFNRSVDRDVPGSMLLFMNSGVLGKLHRHYYDHNGHLYSWSRRSLYLEQITNPGGQHEERRKRVALARLLRPGRFDWELKIDADSTDLVNTIATAFVTMRTQWLPSRRYAIAASGSRLSSSGGTDSKATEAQDLAVLGGVARTSPELLVYQPAASKKEPRNFFNPPKFLEYKYTGKVG